MAAKPGFFDYVAAAFNARPFGMFVAPNWIGVAAAGLLGVINPGFWVVGAGLELGYLFLLSTNARFQRTVAAAHLSSEPSEEDRRLLDAIAKLSSSDRECYVSFTARCRSILDLQRQTAGIDTTGLDAQSEGLNRLSWMYLKLLLARHAIDEVLADPKDAGRQDPAARRAALERQLNDPSIDADLKRSLSAQLEILDQRLARRREAQRKRDFITAEQNRIEQQVELIREQAALSTDPESLSQRIDAITATLGSTSQWIRDQQQVLGSMEDLLTDAPPPMLNPRAKESQ